MLVPEALAYASIAGVSPVVGLYAAPPALLLYAAFGSSRHLVVGPMSATAALSAAAVADLTTGGPDDVLAFTAVLALMTGALALAAGLLRLGFLANFISEPVLKGFIIGLALTIIIGQVPKLFGIDKSDGDFFEQAWGVLSHLGDTHGRTLAIGAASLAVVLTPAALRPGGARLARRRHPRRDRRRAVRPRRQGRRDRRADRQRPARRSACRTGASAADYLQRRLGRRRDHARRLRRGPRRRQDVRGAGPLRDRPQPGADRARRRQRRRRTSTGMVVNGSLSKTAVNGSAGARSQVSGLAVAVLTVVTLLFLTSLFENLPEATLAAVVIAAVVELVDIDALRGYYRMYSRQLGRIYGRAARADFIAAVAAMVGVLVFDTLPGLVIGIVVSLLLLLYRASRPHVAELGRVVGTAAPVRRRRATPREPVDPAVPCCASRPGSSSPTPTPCGRREARAGAGTLGVVVDAEAVAFVDVTAVRMLEELAGDLAVGTPPRRGPRPRAGRRPPGRRADRDLALPTIDDAIAAVRAAAPSGEDG